MKHEVRGKTFEINLVNNWCHEKYAELSSLAFDLADDTSILEARTITGLSGLKATRSAVQNKREIVKQIVEIRQDILKELMTTNGYEYDPVWWERSTDPDDLNDFIIACMKKDASSANVKKK